jgi:hypothetical protein
MQWRDNMKLFCRHCWKFVDFILIENKPHISAICATSSCNNFIKHLNKSEKTTALKSGLKVKKIKEKFQHINKHHYRKRTNGLEKTG